MPTSDQREIVFARIREALREPAPHRHDDRKATNQPTPTAESFRQWLPPVGPSLDEQIALFAKNTVDLKADFYVVTSPAEAIAQLATLGRENNWKRVASHGNPLAKKFAEQLGLPCVLTDSGYAVADLELCDVAITGCDALVAQTGSVFVTTPSAGGRALSVLPPHHVVIAQRSQVVPDLLSALQLARKRYASNWPSFTAFITGPSRTGDIERILVLGAHGPKKLTIFLLPD